MFREFNADVARQVGATDENSEITAVSKPAVSKAGEDDDPANARNILKREEKLARRLRKEANAINDAFTRYAFQALSICGAALGAIIAFMFAPVGEAFPFAVFSHSEHGQPLLGLAAAPILVFAIAVCRMGSFNFTDANRLFGYELHLGRIRVVPARYKGRWRDAYRDIDWEEAMRAWRIVQSTLFNAIYRRPTNILRHSYREKFDQARNPRPVWFIQRTMFGKAPNARLYATRYLVWWQALLHSVGAIAVAILWMVPIRTFYGKQHLISYLIDKSEWDRHFFAYSIATFLFAAVLFCGASWFDRRNDRKPRRAKYVYRFFTVALSLLLTALLLWPNSHSALGVAFWKAIHALPAPSLAFGVATIAELAAAVIFLCMLVLLWKRPIYLLGVLLVLLVGDTALRPDDLQFPYYRLPLLKRWLDPGAGEIFLLISLLMAALSTLALWMSARNERSRRQLLSDGLLSIHATAITWQAVVVAHYSAIESARKWNLSSGQLAELSERLTADERKQWISGAAEFGDLLAKMTIPRGRDFEVDGAGYTGYNFWLSQEAISLARCADDVPGWTGLGEKKLRTLGSRMSL